MKPFSINNVYQDIWLKQAIANVRLERLEPSDEALGLMHQVVLGTLRREEAIANLKKKYTVKTRGKNRRAELLSREKGFCKQAKHPQPV